MLERRLRHRIGEMVAQQAIEDEGAVRAPRRQGLYHRYNAILKRRTGDTPRAQMSLQELEAAVSWLNATDLPITLTYWRGDPRYSWTICHRREWTPPVGRIDAKPRGASKTSVSRHVD